MDTIFALATAQGRAGVAVVRISGPQAFRLRAAFVWHLATSAQGRSAFDLRDGDG